MRSGLVSSAFFIVLASCGSKATEATATDTATVTDSTLTDSTGGKCQHPTPPKDVCQENWCANPYGVGMPCTKGGGECDANIPKDDGINMGAVMCTAVYGNGDDAFCTKPCGADEDCGAGARCAGDPKNPNSGKGCILIACSPYPDAVSSDDVSSSGGDVTATTDAKPD